MEEGRQALVSSSSSSSSSSSQGKRGNKKLVLNIASLSSPLPDNVVEEIFLKLPVNALMRLKCLSKQWRSTIESHCFSQMHLKISERSHVDHPHIMIITWNPDNKIITFRSVSLESVEFLPSNLFKFPHPFQDAASCASESCDGLFCVYSPKTLDIYVVNPATRWFRQLPPARFQILMDKSNPTALDTWGDDMKSVYHLAFVKGSDYKLVWLYNSDKHINADGASPNEGATKCEVFDFKTNTWRYLSCTPSYRIFHDQKPASANRSLYWFTEPYNNAEIKVIAFDIHTETFRLLPKPSSFACSDPCHIDMCTLDNSLCMYETKESDNIQKIWRLKSSEDAWEQIYTVNLLSSHNFHYNFVDILSPIQKDLVEPSTPMAIYKNKKIMLSHRYTRNLVNPETERLRSLFKNILCIVRSVPYFPSLISHL
ncbi:putative F-box/kelch-repeat protein At1g12870 [Capsella rubella]|uniref:putative F-box/kelch-repeat protein At1g12870 n=1 Tax=Capsella rubella TaxID=81985 RepID=UPI000CD4B17D|nr:putative F-box/kelch-repeat protein At1g12870 [Capsella rubella]